jgi:hypothetical protein
MVVDRSTVPSLGKSDFLDRHVSLNAAERITVRPIARGNDFP